MLPTGRMFSRITQKWPSRKVSDRTNQRPNSRGEIFFHEIFPERGEKGPQTALLPLLSLINELKTGLFTDSDSEMVKK
jgi:hypothetical protein